MKNLIKVAADTGESYAVAGAQWTWKVRSSQTAGGFCFFEMTVASGKGVPLHVHTYPEAFYLVEGEVEFHSNDGAAILKCGPGDVILARAEIQHAFFNNATKTARLLSISVGAHGEFFDAVVAADHDEPFASMPAEEAFGRVMAIGSRTDTNFIMPQPPLRPA